MFFQSLLTRWTIDMSHSTNQLESLPPEKLAELRRLRDTIDREERDEIVDKLRKFKRRRELALAELTKAVELLKAERAVQGISLADMEQRTGMSRAAICRLENLEEANPTVSTLTRIADALGKQLVIGLIEK